MKRKNILLAVILMVGGFIGFDPFTPTQTLQATDVFMPRYIDVPRDSKGLSLTIDLQSEKVTIGEDSKDATVTINKATEMQPVYLTREVEKPVYITDTRMVNRLLNKYAPLELPKLTIDYKKINRNRD